MQSLISRVPAGVTPVLPMTKRSIVGLMASQTRGSVVVALLIVVVANIAFASEEERWWWRLPAEEEATREGKGANT